MKIDFMDVNDEKKQKEGHDMPLYGANSSLSLMYEDMQSRELEADESVTPKSAPSDTESNERVISMSESRSMYQDEDRDLEMSSPQLIMKSIYNRPETSPNPSKAYPPFEMTKRTRNTGTVKGENANANVPMPAPPEVADSFEEGVKTAWEANKLSWQNIWKKAQKEITSDKDKIAALQQEIDSISNAYDNLPETEGWGTIASVGTNVVTGLLPAAVASLIAANVAPIAGTIAGAGVVVGDLANAASQADLEVDSFERATGIEVEPDRRTAYIVASTATDVLMNVMLSADVLKKMPNKVVQQISSDIKEKILKNPVAQEEFGTMVQQVMRNERKALSAELAGQVAKSAVEGSVTSAMQKGEESIYTGELPELSQIVSSSLGGAVGGALAGAGSVALNSYNRHVRRKNSDGMYLVSQTNRQEGDFLPISELQNVRETEDGYVGDVINSHNLQKKTVPIDVDNISYGSYKEQAAKGIHSGPGILDVSDKRMQDYESRWAKVRGKDDPESRAEQNEIIQELATEMGVPVKVYNEVGDIPSAIRSNSVVDESHAMTVEANEILLPLSKCQDLNMNNIRSILTHEAVVHYGLPRLFENEDKYNKFLKDVRSSDRFEKLLKEENGINLKGRGPNRSISLDDVEENIALEAETRQYRDKRNAAKGGTKSVVHRVLRDSENHLINSTLNEKMKNWSQYDDDIRMPTMYELEMLRRSRQKSKKKNGN